MKLLNGRELADYIKERQARQTRSLIQSKHIQPKLAIIQCRDDLVINTYVRLKRRYGADIGVAVEVFRVEQAGAPELIKQLNRNPAVHGIIVQLPLSEPEDTDTIVNLVAPGKDVDALGQNAQFEPATPMAILWLLAGYNIALAGKKILLIGRGKLVGAPLEKIFQSMELDVAVVDRGAKDLATYTKEADIIITATGSPAIIYADMIKSGAVVVDAGVASEDGKTVGDLAPNVYRRQDLTLTPVKGGVGPLTVCALFENVLLGAKRLSETAK